MYRGLPLRVAGTHWSRALLRKKVLVSAVIASMRVSLLWTRALPDPSWLRSKMAPKVTDLAQKAWIYFGSVAKV